MRVLTIIHEADAGPGVFLDAFSDSGATVDTWVRLSRRTLQPRAYDAIFTFGGSAHPTSTTSIRG